MVDLALPRRLHAIGHHASIEAEARRAGSVEAEHLLLAILAHRAEPATVVLAGEGLDYEALAAALDAERARSLAAVGIAAPTNAVLTATARTSAPGWGASIREVLRGADKPAAKDGRAGALEIELAVSILSANLGTVPRALAIAGLDRTALVGALRRGGSSV